ncbi:MAG: hypothetical protein OEZ39_19485 [Gammaproteobacteria bacterium]|nr:hypothetical protein [Gammaproteobacteria bacterium]MDH5654049.1 hypothetical protein [Gammaproteobacteria bacterium]
MKIVGIEGMTDQEVMDEIQKGGKFVIYQYCISIIIMSFRQPSNIYFIKSDQGSVGKGLGFSLITLLLGWWGIPWGPIYSIGSLYTNFSGGKNVTNDILSGAQGE